MIGNYRNGGRAWCKAPEAVLVHDWPQDSIGQAVPYGIYDVSANRGYVCVGDCFDTPRFAVEAVADWWRDEGCVAYRSARRLLVLADAGGSNNCRSRVWKAQLQEQLCDACGLAGAALALSDSAACCAVCCPAWATCACTGSIEACASNAKAAAAYVVKRKGQ